MRRIILEEWVSLDGYAADKNGKLDFFPSTESNQYSDQDQLRFLDTLGTILLGRKTYELFVDFWPTATVDKEIIADKLNSLPKLVFSNSLKEAPWGNWPQAQVIDGDAVEKIKALKQQPGKDMVIWGSLSLAQSMIQNGLIDEYHIQVCPVITGGGRSVFPDLQQYAHLKLVSAKQYDTGVMNLQYQVQPLL
jgi:dihydrofolate reductase